jgi:pantoate--beta-alanine ligase
MRIARSLEDLRTTLARWRSASTRVGFVPTMGNLHAGHHSLMALAREHADRVVASVFVNPTQFGPGEDFARYPRTPEADADGLAAHGCDLLYLPRVEDLYPYGPEATVVVHVPGVTTTLEGALRPGHFDGVATVVAKLFNHVEPDVAVFGQKDYQQLLVVRRMVRDLGHRARIVAAPIVREANGLAMSSRNQYLDAQARERAGVIHRTLIQMASAIGGGATVAAAELAARSALEDGGLVPDYAVIRAADDLGQVRAGEPAVALIAARLGSTRLIDNLLLGTT